MKNKKLLLGLIIVLLIIGCNSSNLSTPPVPAQNIKVSECQKNKIQRTSNNGKSIDNKHTYVSYKYENSILFLKHYNSSFNCHPDTIISANILKKNRSISIIEKQDLSHGRMRCMCLRDIELTIKLKPNSYQIHVINSPDDEVSFTVNLKEKKEGMVIQERLSLPI